MAYDVQRFNELTKQMCAYAHFTRDEHAAGPRRGPGGAPRPPARRADQPAAAVPRRRRVPGAAAPPRPAGLRHPAHQAAGRRVRRRRARGAPGSSATSGCAPASTPGRGRPLPRRLQLRRRWGLPTRRDSCDGAMQSSRCAPRPAACRSVSSPRSTLTSSRRQLAEEISELGDVIEQAAAGVRRRWAGRPAPAGATLGGPPGRPGACATPPSGGGRDRPGRTTPAWPSGLQHRGHRHNVAAGGAQRRRAPLRSPGTAHVEARIASFTLAMIAGPQDGRSGNRTGPVVAGGTPPEGKPGQTKARTLAEANARRRPREGASLAARLSGRAREVGVSTATTTEVPS